MGEGSAVFDANFFSEALRLIVGKASEGSAQERPEKVVATNGKLETHLGRRGDVALRRPTCASVRTPDLNIQVPAGRKFLEMMTGHVCVEFDLVGHFCRRHAIAGLTDHEVDRTSRRISERRSDGRHCGRELIWGEWGVLHTDILPTRIGEISARPPARSSNAPH